jgi:2-iminobutanoate/2-iminopropanoate deaminase
MEPPTMSIQFLNVPGLPASHLPFSPAVRAGDFLFISGQASVDDTGKIVNDTLEGEIRRSMANLHRILRGAGLDWKDVVQMRCYVARQEDLPEYNRVYADVIPKPYPTRTTLMGCLGTLIKFEVDAMAYCGK